MPVVPLTIQAQFTYHCAGVASATNVVHFLDIGGTFDQTNMDGLADNWVDHLADVLNANWFLDRSVRILDLSTDPPGEIFTTGVGGNGSVTGSALPPAATACVGISAGADRRRRGRIYLPGMTESQWSDLGLASTGVPEAIAQAVNDAALDIALENGYVLAVYSRMDGVSRAVQTITCDEWLDTQRRRQSRLAS